MSRIKIELNEDGIRELLKSSEMQDVLKEYANDMNLLYDDVKVYKKRAAIHEKGDDNDTSREKN